jgi:hypothetical protein
MKTAQSYSLLRSQTNSQATLSHNLQELRAMVRQR